MSVRSSLVACFTIGATTGLLVLAACGGGYSSNPTPAPSPTQSPSADVTITIQGQRGNQSYSPSPMTVRVGQRVAWQNADTIAHTATQDASGFNTGNLAAGATSSPITMSTAGTFPYHCTIHPGMVGTITVQ